MAESKPGIGTIVWCDLTVNDAETVRDFYAAVVGWKAEPVEMGGVDATPSHFPLEVGPLPQSSALAT